MEALDLVGPQFGVDARGQRGRHARLDLGGPALNLLGLVLGEELAGGGVGQLKGVQALRLGCQARAD
jgi:hypothetical protein